MSGLGTNSDLKRRLAKGYYNASGAADQGEATGTHTSSLYVFNQDDDDDTKNNSASNKHDESFRYELGAQFDRNLSILDAQHFSPEDVRVDDSTDVMSPRDSISIIKEPQIHKDEGYSSGHYPTTISGTQFDAKNEAGVERLPLVDAADDNTEQSIRGDLITQNHHIDIESVASDTEDIQSQIETQRTQHVVQGEQELQRLFLRNSTILALARQIMERTDSARFVRCFRRLLKGYYKELRKCARSSLEKVATELLRSRYARVRLAQALLYKIDPSYDVHNQPLPVKSYVTKKRLEFEAWLATLPDPQNDSSRPDEEMQESDDQISVSSIDEVELPESQVLVHITELQMFFGATAAFDNLLLEMALLIIPEPSKTVARTIMAVPSDNIRTESDHEELYSKLPIIGRFLRFSRHDSDTSPPTIFRPEAARNRIKWRCYCNRTLSASITDEHWPLLVNLLRFKGDKCYGQHQCKQTFLPLNYKQESSIAVGHTADNKIKSLPGQAGSGTPSTSSSSAAISHKSTSPSLSVGSTAASSNLLPLSSSGTSHSSTTNATSISSTSILIAGSDLIVLFGAKGRNPYLQIESIDAKTHDDDSKFFRQARKDYTTMRGFLRYFLSVWQFDHCVFVKFSKQLPSIVYGTTVALPTSPEYLYAPRPPDTTAETQIDFHIWSVLFSQPCSETRLSKIFGTCVFSWLHEWLHVCTPTLQTGRVDLLGRIPRKTSPWLVDQYGEDEAWGIRAIDLPSPFYLFFYYLLVLAGPIWYWVRWYSVYKNQGNPPDLQNPSVPLIVVLSVLIAPLAAWQAMLSGPDGKNKQV